MATEDGFDILPYDPYFAPDQSVLESRFDFITCTETAEHFSSPGTEFKQLHSLLKAGGILGVMTSMSADWSQFPNWHYNRDPTHIAYYSRRTLEWVSDSLHMEVDFPTANVAIFRKPSEVR
jgi:cyclopropane fatty-acyl-phospholipid synthase-like methyltransferase